MKNLTISLLLGALAYPFAPKNRLEGEQHSIVFFYRANGSTFTNLMGTEKLRRSVPLIVTLSIWGCTNEPSRSKQDAPPSAGVHASVSEPVSLTVELLAPPLEAGRTNFAIHLDAQAPLSFPVQLQIVLPPDVRLSEGKLIEDLQIETRGRTTRFVSIEGENSQIKVVIHGVSGDQSFGLHAEKSYPPAPPRAFTRPPPPPQARPPIPPRKALASGEIR